MKKILSVILALVVLLAALCVMSLAADSSTAAFDPEGAMTFTVDDKYVMSEALTGIPATFEASINTLRTPRWRRLY